MRSALSKLDKLAGELYPMSGGCCAELALLLDTDRSMHLAHSATCAAITAPDSLSGTVARHKAEALMSAELARLLGVEVGVDGGEGTSFRCQPNGEATVG